MNENGAEGEIRTRELLRDEDLNLAPLTWLGNLRLVKQDCKKASFNRFVSVSRQRFPKCYYSVDNATSFCTCRSQTSLS
jgi:hypothetical protein